MDGKIGINLSIQGVYTFLRTAPGADIALPLKRHNPDTLFSSIHYTNMYILYNYIYKIKSKRDEIHFYFINLI